MPSTPKNFDQLLHEYLVLCHQHGAAQQRCAEVFEQQRMLIQAQQKQIMCLRADAIIAQTTLAFAHPEFTSLEVTSPGPKRQVLEASLVAADLVICQTGCLSHGEYWRVQDHCKRTGKTCVLVAQPEALRIVRIHKSAISDC